MSNQYEKLWKSVVVLALQDALRNESDLRGMDTRTDVHAARSFFESPGWREWFIQCCHMAGFDPNYVKEGYEKAKSRGDYTEILSAMGKKNISLYKDFSQSEREQQRERLNGNGRRRARPENVRVRGR